MLKRKILLMLILLLTSSLLVSASQNHGLADAGNDIPGQSGTNSKIIRMAGIFPLSGVLTTFGDSCKKAMKLAIKQFNSKKLKINGKTLKVRAYYGDTEGRPEAAANVAKKLINNYKVDAIIGAVMSKTSLAIAPLAQRAKIPMISPTSTNPKVTTIGNYIFRACFIDPFQGILMAEYVYRDLKLRKAAVIYDNANDYNKGLAQVFILWFKFLGGEIVAEEAFTDEAKTIDYKAQLTNIKSKNPEFLYIPNYYQSAALIMKQADEIGLKVKFGGGDGWDSPKIVDIGGKVVENGFFTNHYSKDDKRKITQTFVKEYKKAYYSDPDALSALAYDAANIYLRALIKAESFNNEKIRNAIQKTNSEFVTGKITFGRDRNPVKSGVILSIQDGKQKLVKTISPSFATATSSDTEDDDRKEESADGEDDDKDIIVRADDSSTDDYEDYPEEDDGYADENDGHSDENDDYEDDDSIEIVSTDRFYEQLVKLAGIFPMTGNAATFGKSCKQGMQMAVDEFNSKSHRINGKITRVKTYYGDTEGLPERAANVGAKLLHKHKVHGIIGAVMSKNSLAIAPIAQRAKIPMISPTSTNPKVTLQGDYIFRACFIDPYQGTMMAEYAYRDLKMRKAAVLYDNGNDYNKGLAYFFIKRFKELGARIVAQESFTDEGRTVDYKAQLTNIKSKNPDFLYIPNYYNSAALIMIQAREMGLKVKFGGGDGWDSPRLVELGKKSVEKSFFSNHYSHEDPRKVNKTFVKNYQRKYGRKPDALSVLAYDAANIYLRALIKANSLNKKKIRNAINNTFDEFVTGYIKFDRNRNPVKSGVILTIKNGRQRLVKLIHPQNMTSQITAGQNSKRRGGTLVFAKAGDPVGLDPGRETDGESFNVADNVYETLVTYKPGTTEIVPCLATKWDVSRNGRVYTFYLRKGVRFHDGSRFNANAVLFSLNRQLKRSHPFNKYGPWQYWWAMAMDKIVKRIVKVDNYTVKMILHKREAPVLANLAMQFAAIVSPKTAKKEKRNFKNVVAGTGPFKLARWIKRDRIILERFEDYWGQKAYLDRLIFVAIAKPSERYLALENGEVDMIDFPSPDDIDSIEENDALKIVKQSGMNIGYLALNMRKKPFKNKLVRQAINYAINKREIIAEVYGRMGIPAKNPIPPCIWGYNNSIRDYEYNPRKARKLLARAGYKRGFRTTLWAMPVSRPYNPNARKVAEIMQRQLKRVGIRVKIVSYDWGTYLDKIAKLEHGMCLIGWTGDNGDPDNFLYVLLSKDATRYPAQNYAYWKNRQFNRLILRAKESADLRLRTKLYRKAQLVFKREAPWVPIAHSIVMVPMKKKVHGFRIGPIGKREFHRVWIDKSK